MQTHQKINFPSYGHILSKNIGKRICEKMWHGYIKNPRIHQKYLREEGVYSSFPKKCGTAKFKNPATIPKILTWNIL